jgi:hypothetical protein
MIRQRFRMYVAFNMLLNTIHVREITQKSEISKSAYPSRREGQISVDCLIRQHADRKQRYQCEISQKVSLPFIRLYTWKAHDISL